MHIYKEWQAWENMSHWFAWVGENRRTCLDGSESCSKDPQQLETKEHGHCIKGILNKFYDASCL